MSNKMKFAFILLISVSFIIFTGCIPKRVVWQPSGKWAAIFGDEGRMYFCDENGNLTEQKYQDVMQAEWFANNKDIAIERQKTVNNWSEAEKILNKHDRDLITKKADELIGDKILDKWNGPKGMFSTEDNMLKAVKVYLRDKAPEKISKELFDSWKKQNFDLYCLEICSWDNQVFKYKETMLNSISIIWSTKISPDNKKILYTHSDLSLETIKLSAIDIDSKQILDIDETVSMYPDWSADGKSAVYAKIEVKDDVQGFDDMTIGSLKSAIICNKEGRLINKVKKHTQYSSIALNGLAKVRCLKDGKIIFSSIELPSLPCIPDDITEQPLLFMIEPGKHKAIIPLISKSTYYEIAGYDLNLFEVSPDNKYISFIDHDSRVAVLEIATGDVTILQGEKIGDIASIPSWRSNDELCYFSENENGDYVALQKTGEPAKDLSASWPKEIRDDITKD